MNGYQYYHIDCFFKKIKKCHLSTKVPESGSDFEGYGLVPSEIAARIDSGIKDLAEHRKRVRAKNAGKMSRPAKRINKSIPLPIKKAENLTTNVEKQKIKILYTNADILTKDKKTQLLHLHRNLI